MRVALLLLLGISLATPGKAQAQLILEFTALGGLNYASPTQRVGGTSYHWTGQAGLSFGFTVATPIFHSPFDAEIGVFSIKESSEREQAGIAIIQPTQTTQIPLVIRYNFDEHIGMGVGGYISLLDDPTQNPDNGLIVNIRARFNLAPPYFFILDGRYQHGLADRSKVSADYLNTRSMQAFAGFQFILL